MTKIKILSLCLMVAFGFSSCKKKNEVPDLAVPSTYEFYRDDASSVSYSGQTERLDMLSELSDYMSLGNQSTLDETKLLNMYANLNNPFSKANLNQSGDSRKQIRNKVFGTGDGNTKQDGGETQNYFENLFKSLAKLSKSNNEQAESGKAGIIGDGSGSYLVDAFGYETKQEIEIGLQGALLFHQGTNVYLSQTKMAFDNLNLAEGKNYSPLEHQWDESFGYLELPITETVQNAGQLRFWAKMANLLNGENKIGYNWLQRVHTAYRTGRANISQYYGIEEEVNYEARKNAINTIKTEWEVLIAACAIHEINNTLKHIENDGLRHHHLTNARAYIQCLSYAKNGSQELGIYVLLSKLTFSPYTVEQAQLDQIKLDVLGMYPVLNAAKDRL